MIRRAVPADLQNDELLSMGRTFFLESCLPGDFVPHIFSKNWAKFMELELGAIFLYENGGKIVGAIGGVCHPDVNDDSMVCQEMFWFIHPDFRRGSGAMRLFAELQEWAASRKCVRFYMGNACNKHMGKVGKFLERLGFEPAGVSYVRNL